MNLRHWSPRWTPFCFSDASDGGNQAGDSAPGGDSAGGGSGATNGSGSPAPDWSQFVGALEGLGGKLDGLHETVKAGTEANGAREPAAVAPPNFEEMTQTEMASYIESWVGEKIKVELKAALDPIVQFIQGFHQEYLTNSGKNEINRLKATYKDYSDWKDEMIALAKELPTLSLQDVYLLARSRNPTKAAERDRHYAPAAPKVYRAPFSLTPGEGGTKGASGSTTPQTPAEAARAAYAEVAARHPGMLAALDSV